MFHESTCAVCQVHPQIDLILVVHQTPPKCDLYQYFCRYWNSLGMAGLLYRRQWGRERERVRLRCSCIPKPSFTIAYLSLQHQSHFVSELHPSSHTSIKGLLVQDTKPKLPEKFVVVVVVVVSPERSIKRCTFRSLPKISAVYVDFVFCFFASDCGEISIQDLLKEGNRQADTKHRLSYVSTWSLSV